MRNFIETLLLSYGRIAENLPMDADQSRETQFRLNALRLAVALLIKVEINESEPEHLPQVGILGPTQAGKSTLVNLLFQSDAAGVSPLAGYTVHAQGFVVGTAGKNTERAISTLFHDFDHVATEALDLKEFKQYATKEVEAPALKDVSPFILWDSPDFDSVESRGYRSAVLRVVALSDLVVLMVSKDKYADKSVWDMLSLLQPLLHPMGKQILVCINKLNPNDTDVVVNSFLDRYRQSVNANTPPDIIALPYLRGLDNSASQIASDLREQLVLKIQHNLSQSDRAAQKKGAYHFIQKHWDSWLAPVREEQLAKKKWELAVDEALVAGLDRYRSAYLDHPQKYDTFNRALAELLTLLEVPGLAAALTTTRKVVTWPVRKILGFGQSVMDGTARKQAIPLDLEEDVILQANAHVLSRLSNLTLDEQQADQQQAHWWASLGKVLRDSASPLQDELTHATNIYQAEFTPQIEAAAQQLFSNLQEQPTILNALRAARVSTDAAAVVLAVKSGGLAASDLVLAPAMLSLTTMLTESALGKYMDSIKADLKSRQMEKVKSDLFEGVIKRYLYELPQTMNDDTLLLIEDSEVQDALNTLKAEINE